MEEDVGLEAVDGLEDGLEAGEGLDAGLESGGGPDDGSEDGVSEYEKATIQSNPRDMIADLIFESP